MGQNRVVYLSGPMTGWPEFNRPWFDKTARVFRTLGWRVMNPHEFPGEDQLKVLHQWSPKLMWYIAMARDLTMLAWHGVTNKMFSVYVHPRWWKSRGARCEVKLAELLGVPVVYDILQ